MTAFLSNSLKALVKGTVTKGFPSVTLVLQHLVFKMSFHAVLFTAPSPSPGGDEKVILIFQRRPVNYSTGLCIAYSLHKSDPVTSSQSLRGSFSQSQNICVTSSLQGWKVRGAEAPSVLSVAALGP